MSPDTSNPLETIDTIDAPETPTTSDYIPNQPEAVSPTANTESSGNTTNPKIMFASALVILIARLAEEQQEGDKGGPICTPPLWRQTMQAVRILTALAPVPQWSKVSPYDVLRMTTDWGHEEVTESPRAAPQLRHFAGRPRRKVHLVPAHEHRDPVRPLAG